MNCKKCGSVGNEDDKFCLSCGTSFSMRNTNEEVTVENPPLENITNKNVNNETARTPQEAVAEDFPSNSLPPPPFQNISHSNPDEPIWSNDDPHLQFQQKARDAAKNEWSRQQSNRGFWNGIFAVAFSVWTLIVVFAGLFSDNTFWVLLFIIVDFSCSLPAIFQALRGRDHNKKRFLITLIMGVASTAASVLALVWWLAT
ncbi:MAG: hypothetical protein FWC11_02185 [Firmicutes bacterium]|nr:hypothetical protein [Bacillota bacterium]